MDTFSNLVVYHYCPNYKDIDGGINTYVQLLVNYQMSTVSHRILPSFKNLNQNYLNLVHIHGKGLLEKEIVQGIQEKAPLIYTAHSHNVYCPSGSKYLKASQSCCQRKISNLGCTWGHVVNGCGSRRPTRIVNNLLRAYSELQILKEFKIPVVANSNYVRKQFVRNGLPPEQVVTLHCGISMPKVGSHSLTRSIHQNQRILFAGRIVSEKGLDWLLKSLKLTNQRIHLDIAGDGRDKSRLERLANQLGINKQVTWHGWCSKEQLNQLYQQCFALIFPSVWPEPAGLVTLEAYARYRPVIASAVGGIPEYLHHQETGLLVPANNIQTLATAITELSTDYTKAKYLGEQGYKLLTEKFTLDLHVQRLQKVYEQTINNFKDKTPK